MIDTPTLFVEVRNEKTIVVQPDKAKRTDNNGLSESQEYEYSPDHIAPKIVVTLRKDGRWRRKGESIKSSLIFSLGVRRMYQDLSF